MDIFKKEPALITGGVTVALAFIIAFGLTLSTGQVAAVVGIAAFIQAVVTRAMVVPLAKLPAIPVPPVG